MSGFIPLLNTTTAAEIATAVWSSAPVVDANIKYVNDIEVKGTGEEGDPWNPV